MLPIFKVAPRGSLGAALDESAARDLGGDDGECGSRAAAIAAGGTESASATRPGAGAAECGGDGAPGGSDAACSARPWPFTATTGLTLRRRSGAWGAPRVA